MIAVSVRTHDLRRNRRADDSTCPGWRRLTVLLMGSITAFSLAAPGALAQPMLSPHGSDHITVLLPPGTEPGNEQITESAATALLDDPAGRELIKADRQFTKPTKAEIAGSVGNVSVEWFDLSWLRSAEGIPNWLRDNPEDLLERLLEARESPVDTGGAYQTSTKAVKHEGNEKLYERIGATSSSLLMQVSTSSEYQKRHSEMIPLEWLERFTPLILREMAKTKPYNVYIASKAANKLTQKILERSPLYIVSQRTPCLNKCDFATRHFPQGLAITYYGHDGSKHAGRAKLIVPQVMQKAEAKLRRRESDESEQKRRKNLGFCGTTGESAGHGGSAGGGRVLAMAASPLAAPCIKGGSSGLSGLLSADDYGGVDFSTLELRYMSDRPDSGDLRYSLSGRPASPDIRQNLESGLQAVTDVTADLRTWLVLDPQKFWVNLSPMEPDRIIDPALGQTNAGRAMLEADLQMKRTEGKLLNPKTSFGARYWKALTRDSDTACFSARIWIVPGEVQVHEDGDSLYILKTSLAVKAEPEDIGGPYSCKSSNTAAGARQDRLYQSMVVPKIVKAVNSSPEYAPLRRAFTARVMAQWIRKRHQSGRRTSFDELIDSGNLGGAKLADDWRPRKVFDNYVRSIRDGEFTVKQTVRQGRVTLVSRMVFGGVDFSNIPMTAISAEEMNRRYPQLRQTAQTSTELPKTGPDGSIWLGETHKTQGLSSWGRITDEIGGLVNERAGVLALILVALGAIGFGFRNGSGRKRRPTP